MEAYADRSLLRALALEIDTAIESLRSARGGGAGGVMVRLNSRSPKDAVDKDRFALCVCVCVCLCVSSSLPVPC